VHDDYDLSISADPPDDDPRVTRRVTATLPTTMPGTAPNAILVIQRRIERLKGRAAVALDRAFGLPASANRDAHISALVTAQRAYGKLADAAAALASGLSDTVDPLLNEWEPGPCPPSASPTPSPSPSSACSPSTSPTA
jgi:hypothetical protein